jgi:transcriptional regulator with XRE-family HTH domain
MEELSTYTLQELFEDLPISIAELARRSNINEVTLARIRDGKATRRPTANRLLLELSKAYDRMLTLRNVTGIKVQGSERKGQKQEEKWLRSPGYGVLSLRNHLTPQP